MPPSKLFESSIDIISCKEQQRISCMVTHVPYPFFFFVSHLIQTPLKYI